MKLIYKYPLSEVVSMPKHASILSVQLQNDEPVIWAEVYADTPTEQRYFKIYYTGEPLKVGESVKGFWGTLQKKNGIVIHIYEINKL